jgi:hypothetical protein
MATQPFGRGECDTQSHDAHGPARPQEARQRDAERDENRQPRRQADHGNRQQPAKGRRIDEEGIADPIKAGEKVAEAEPPPVVAAPVAPRQLPLPAPSISQTSVGKVKQDRPDVERRHGQRR